MNVSWWLIETRHGKGNDTAKFRLNVKECCHFPPCSSRRLSTLLSTVQQFFSDIPCKDGFVGQHSWKGYHGDLI
jgi:hypothetical protein